MDPYDIEQAFAAIEEELIESIIRNMRLHHGEEMSEDKQWTMWQIEQLKALEKYKTDNRTRFRSWFSDINGEIGKLIREANQRGYMDQEIEILQAIKDGFKGYKKVSGTMQAEFFQLNREKLEALISATTNDMEKAETAILRMADDQYRKAIFNAQVYANSGAGTYEKAVDMAMKDMLASGLNCVQYGNGTRHTLRDYADMSIRTASKRAYLQGEGVKRKEWGITTVIINKRGNPCPKCLPFCGKILIDDVWSGGSDKGVSSVTGLKYPLMSKAIAAGLYHPRCKDSHTTYFEGISTPPDDKYTKKELDRLAEDYRKEQEERYARRQEMKYERLAKYSLDGENRKKYAIRKEEWKRKIHIVNTDTSGIIKSGARIKNIFSEEAKDFAQMYYKEIRSFSTDVKKIAENLNKNEEDIRKIKAYLFEDESLYDSDEGTWRRFDPDCAIAQSWQRLMMGKGIKPHDRTLIEHELLEMQIKEENPDIEHWKAHEIASGKYDYGKEAMEYYGNLERHKENGE